MLELCELTGNPVVLVALTLAVFVAACRLHRSTGSVLLNPILVSVVVLVALLSAVGIDYATYRECGGLIEFWLKPAVVALGVPLYRQLSLIRRQLLPILFAELSGCVAGVVSVVLVARMLGASQQVIVSLAPKAVTTPIAMEISGACGGLTALTAAVVVCTGIFGAMAGFKMVELSGISSPMAAGLSVGTASHAVGTSAAMRRSQRYGAFSSLGLTLNGLLTALLAPLILDILGGLNVL